MKSENDSTCNFCFTEQEDLVNAICPTCGYPMKGSKQEQDQFTKANEKLKQKIDEAETALSQARFAMLWPSLTAIILSFSFNFPPKNIPLFAGTLIFYSIFVIAYFVIAWKPLPILILSAMILLSGILFSISKGVLHNTLLIVPGVILLIYINGIYSVWRAEKALDAMSLFQLKKN